MIFLFISNSVLFLHIQEGNLKRYPTPYPDELKNMVKTAQSVAHRLSESGEGSGKESKPAERNHIGIQDVGVKVSIIFISEEEDHSIILYMNVMHLPQVIEAPCPNGVPADAHPPVSTDSEAQNPSTEDSKDTSESVSSQKAQMKSSEASTMNHEDTLEVVWSP